MSMNRQSDIAAIANVVNPVTVNDDEIYSVSSASQSRVPNYPSVVIHPAESGSHINVDDSKDQDSFLQDFNVLPCDLSLHRNGVEYENIGRKLNSVLENEPIYQDVNTLLGVKDLCSEEFDELGSKLNGTSFSDEDDAKFREYFRNRKLNYEKRGYNVKNEASKSSSYDESKMEKVTGKKNNAEINEPAVELTSHTKENCLPDGKEESGDNLNDDHKNPDICADIEEIANKCVTNEDIDRLLMKSAEIRNKQVIYRRSQRVKSNGCPQKSVQNSSVNCDKLKSESENKCSQDIHETQDNLTNKFNFLREEMVSNNSLSDVVLFVITN